MKKKIANGRRSGKGVSAGGAQNRVEARQLGAAGEVQVDEATIKHLQTVVSMIEGRKVSREEILELVRQHSMAKEKKLPYAADDPDENSG